MVFYTGGCHCQRVQYCIYREKPLDSKYCHCRECQALHGAPMQWACVFRKVDVKFTKGLDDLAFYYAPDRSTNHLLPCKVSCGHCRAPLMDEGNNILMLFPTNINFTDSPKREGYRGRTADEKRSLFAPQCHIFYGSRVCDIPDGKPKFKTHKGGEEVPEVVGGASPPTRAERRQSTRVSRVETLKREVPTSSRSIRRSLPLTPGQASPAPSVRALPESPQRADSLLPMRADVELPSRRESLKSFKPADGLIHDEVPPYVGLPKQNSPPQRYDWGMPDLRMPELRMLGEWGTSDNTSETEVSDVLRDSGVDVVSEVFRGDKSSRVSRYSQESDDLREEPRYPPNGVVSPVGHYG